MDLAIRFPTQGRIHLESRFLFGEPDDRNCRQFVERVFQAPEITQITIRSRAGSSDVPRPSSGFVRELIRSSRSSTASKTRSIPARHPRTAFINPMAMPAPTAMRIPTGT